MTYDTTPVIYQTNNYKEYDHKDFYHREPKLRFAWWWLIVKNDNIVKKKDRTVSSDMN